MSAAFIVSWTGTGVVAGGVLAVGSGRLLTSTPSIPTAAKVAVPLLTALAFGTLAVRFDRQFDLLPYTVLVVVGIALSLIDLLERRLPSVVVYSGVALVGGLLATSAILHSRGPDFLRALAGMAILAAFFLVLALVSGGDLGAGDVKFGGLLGLALGWLSWSALVTATFLGWFAAALAWLLLRAARRTPQGSLLPMGPFLLLGALLTISLMPI